MRHPLNAYYGMYESYLCIGAIIGQSKRGMHIFAKGPAGNIKNGITLGIQAT